MDPSTEPNLNTAKVVGRQLRRYRRLAGMTQEALANSAGLSRTYLARLELGRANPTLSVLDALAEALRIDPRKLFYEFEQ